MGKIKLIITSPSGKTVEALIEQTESGFRVKFSPGEIGDYRIEIFWGDTPVTESPFRLKSVPMKTFKRQKKINTDCSNSLNNQVMSQLSLSSTSNGAFATDDDLSYCVTNLPK